jgi:hypothetical protein
VALYYRTTVGKRSVLKREYHRDYRGLAAPPQRRLCRCFLPPTHCSRGRYYSVNGKLLPYIASVKNKTLYIVPLLLSPSGFGNSRFFRVLRVYLRFSPSNCRVFHILSTRNTSKHSNWQIAIGQNLETKTPYRGFARIHADKNYAKANCFKGWNGR